MEKKKKLRIKSWKDWWLVGDDKGITKAQFKNKRQAEDFRGDPINDESPCLQRVSQRFGQTIRHINVYP